MDNSQFPTARKSGLVVQEVPDEVLVFDLYNNKGHCLNQTASMVWKACDGKTSVSEIAKIVGSQTGKGVSDDLVWLAIDQLNENSLLEKKIRPKFSGESRRDVIKKIGLAAVVAMPVVASLVAPRNALANVSCVCGISFDCTLSGFETCASQCCCNLAGICAEETDPNDCVNGRAAPGTGNCAA